MPSDEQRMREQFEKWIDEKQYGLGWQDGTGSFSEFLRIAWAGYQAAATARDAEVQALRKLVDHAKRIFQNAEVRSGYCMCGETPERHDNSADCPYTDQGQWESDLWLKRAALAGGEEGEAE